MMLQKQQSSHIALQSTVKEDKKIKNNKLLENSLSEINHIMFGFFCTKVYENCLC
jgi:hypothetical protein